MSARPRLLLLLLVPALVLAACSSSDGSDAAGAAGIVVEDATVDRPLNPEVAAVRMVLRNEGDGADALVGASSPIAASVTLHRSDVDAEGRSTMAIVKLVPIPVGDEVTFGPGGLHVMLNGLTEPLEVGDEVPLTLTFGVAGDVEVTAKVIEPVGLGEEGSDG